MTILGILVPIALILALIALIGSRLPKTHVAASRQILEVTVDEAWAIVTNFTEYPKWRRGLTRVEDGPLIDGLPSWYEYCAPRIKVHLQITECEFKKRLVTRLVGEKLPIFGAWEYEFAENNRGTLLTITERDKVYNPILRFFTLLVFPHHAAMDVFLIALARHCGSKGEPIHLSLKAEEFEPDTASSESTGS